MKKIWYGLNIIMNSQVIRMKLSVPFLPDKIYTQFLKQKIGLIESVFFSLQTGPVLDARTRFHTVEIETVVSLLKELPGVQKYCLLNSRFIHPETYFDYRFLKEILSGIETLMEHDCLSGLVFTDFYFLQALSQTKTPFFRQIEAVPGINCMIDSSRKAFSFLEFIESSCFKLPGNLILDRSLNREPLKLLRVGSQIKKRYPDIRLTLLANEGCLFHCPFKLTHDAHISLSNTGMAKNTTRQMNQDMGCIHYLMTRPVAFLKSPFIRPEDIFHYETFADTIKLCGRTLGRRFLTTCVEAYINQSYDGNLLDLMDAASWMADHYHVDNKSLGIEFFRLVTSCTKNCKTCMVCQERFGSSINKKAFELKPFKEYQ